MSHLWSTCRRVACIAVLAILAGAAPEALAAPPSCAKLAGHDLLKAGSIKLVDKRAKRGGRVSHTYVACPENSDSARQFTLRASRKGGALTALDSAGAFVVVRDVSARSVDVWDIVKRKRTRLTDGGSRPSGNVVIDKAGDIAAVFGTSLVGFDAGVKRYVLDAGPVAGKSLKRDARAGVTWTVAGTRKRADLGTPSLPCAELPGKTVFSTAEAVVTETTYRDDYLFSLDGVGTRTRACVLPDGPVRLVGDQAFGTETSGGGSIRTAAGAGHFLLLWEYNEASAGEIISNDYTLYDIAADKRAKLWTGRTEGEDPSPAQVGDEFLGAVVTAGGQVGAAFGVESTTKQIVGFDSAGTPRVLDKAPGSTIDEKSLRLDGAILHWTSAGADHAADLAAPGP